MVAIASPGPLTLTLRHPGRAVPRYALRRGLALLTLTLALALGALVADAAVGALSISGDGTARSADAESSVPAQVHVVRPGDTLWTIAAEAAPDRDRRAVVDELVELNGSASIQIGQRIVLP